MMRLAAWLLRLYPRTFRHAHGRELMQVVRTARARGDLPGIALVADLTRSMAREWLARPRLSSRRPRGSLMQDLFRDLRYAVRLLVKQPGFTVAATLTLALGIGANTAIFSLAHATLLRPVEVPQLDRLASWPWASAYPNFRDYTQRTDIFRGVMAWSGGGRVNIATPDNSTDLASTMFVSGGGFDVLGLKPALGRLLLPSDDVRNGPIVAVLGHDYWRSRFGADPSVVGSTLQVKGHPVTVVGVLQEGFRGFSLGTVPAIYVPLTATPRLRGAFFTEPGLFDTTNIVWLNVVGRLRDEVTLEQASSAIDAHYRRLHPPKPGTTAEPLTLVPFKTRALSANSSDAIERFVLLLVGVVALTLLIGCANLANLLLAQSAGRRHEVGVRFAIGATRARVVRQMLIESTLLATLGGAAGLLVASATLGLLGAFQLPGGINIETLGLSLNGWPLAATFVLALGTGVLVGIAPAWQGSRTDPLVILREEVRGGGAHRTRGALVAVQIAISLVLLVGSVLFARSLARALEIPTGFDATGVVTASINPGLVQYDETQARAFHAMALERVRALPGVTAAGWSSLVPVNGLMRSRVHVAGHHPADGQEPDFNFAHVSADYFAAAGTRVLQGRAFVDADAHGQPVAIISQAAADRFWPGRDPVGAQLRTNEKEPWRTIVGVVEDVTAESLSETPTPYLFLPFAETGSLGFVRPTDPAHLFVRTDGDLEPLLGQVAAQLRAIDPRLPVYDVVPFADHVRELIMPQQMGATLLALFSLLALSLASVGIYGVASYVTQLRTRELGIRMALGADAADVRRIVLRHGVRPAAIGVLLGIGLAIWAARFARAFLYDVSTTDPLTFTVVPTILLLIAFIATWLPARRASRLDPVTALREP